MVGAGNPWYSSACSYMTPVSALSSHGALPGVGICIEIPLLLQGHRSHWIKGLIHYELILTWVLLVAQMAKNLPAMQETQVQSLGWEDPMEKGMATHSSILAWRIPWTEQPGGLQSMGHKESDTTEGLTQDILTWLYQQRPYFQIRSHSQLPGVKTSTCLCGVGKGGTIQPITAPMTQHSDGINVLAHNKDCLGALRAAEMRVLPGDSWTN